MPFCESKDERKKTPFRYCSMVWRVVFGVGGLFDRFSKWHLRLHSICHCRLVWRTEWSKNGKTLSGEKTWPRRKIPIQSFISFNFRFVEIESQESLVLSVGNWPLSRFGFECERELSLCNSTTPREKCQSIIACSIRISSRRLTGSRRSDDLMRMKAIPLINELWQFLWERTSIFKVVFVVSTASRRCFLESKSFTWTEGHCLSRQPISFTRWPWDREHSSQND